MVPGEPWTWAGALCPLQEVATELCRRLVRIFLARRDGEPATASTVHRRSPQPEDLFHFHATQAQGVGGGSSDGVDLAASVDHERLGTGARLTSQENQCTIHSMNNEPVRSLVIVND